MKNLTPEYPFIPAKEKIISFFQSDVSTGSMITKTGNLNSSPNETSVGSGNNIFKITSGGIHLGAAAFSSAPFSVSMEGLLKATGAEISGNITATTGAIGGWTIAATALSNGNMSISSSTGINFNSVFTVNASGAMTATSGTIGGWTLGSTTISATSITLDSGNQRISVGATSPILIDGANKKIESSNYVSGYAGSGFHIDENLMEVGNIACRGLIRTSVFQKDVISTVGGNLMVLDGDVLDTDMTALDSSTMTTKDTTTFSVGDILRIKDGIDDEWFEVTNATSAPTYTVTRDKDSAYTSNNNPAWKKGATIVNYGQSGDGGLYMTASETNAPYLSVFTHAGSPWSAMTTRLRIGNLNGYLGYTTDEYGIAIGETNKYFKYDPDNGLEIKGKLDHENIYWSTFFESLDGYAKLENGGTVDFDVLSPSSQVVGVQMKTAATTDENVYLIKDNFYNSFLSFDTDFRIRSNIRIWQNTNQTIYITSGGNITNDHIGFKIVDNEIFGSCADGTTQSLTDSLLTLSAGMVLKLEARLKVGNKVEFTITRSGTEYIGELSTNLPSGIVDSILYVEVNPDEDLSKELSLYYWDIWNSN
jgi:hypothetical protein